jgi:hypothetical protein
MAKPEVSNGHSPHKGFITISLQHTRIANSEDRRNKDVCGRLTILSRGGVSVKDLRTNAIVTQRYVNSIVNAED